MNADGEYKCDGAGHGKNTFCKSGTAYYKPWCMAVFYESTCYQRPPATTTKRINETAD